jgi:hypothetical protein
VELICQQNERSGKGTSETATSCNLNFENHLNFSLGNIHFVRSFIGNWELQIRRSLVSRTHALTKFTPSYRLLLLIKNKI